MTYPLSSVTVYDFTPTLGVWRTDGDAINLAGWYARCTCEILTWKAADQDAPTVCSCGRAYLERTGEYPFWREVKQP